MLGGQAAFSGGISIFRPGFGFRIVLLLLALFRRQVAAVILLKRRKEFQPGLRGFEVLERDLPVLFPGLPLHLVLAVI